MEFERQPYNKDVCTHILASGLSQSGYKDPSLLSHRCSYTHVLNGASSRPVGGYAPGPPRYKHIPEVL